MARFIEGYSPTKSSSTSSAKGILAEVKKGIVGNTVSDGSPIGDRGSTALSGADMTDPRGPKKKSSSTSGSSSSSSSSSSRGGGGYGGGGVVASTASDPYAKVMQLIKETAQANNEWSAAQAQKQMDFQERLSSTAHQREVADLQAAGLNPVLSAGGSGASTPTGAMAQTDDSNTRLLAEVAMESVAAMASTASGVVGVARKVAGNDSSFLGKLTNMYSNNKLFKKGVDTAASVATTAARYALLKAIL